MRGKDGKLLESAASPVPFILILITQLHVLGSLQLCEYLQQPGSHLLIDSLLQSLQLGRPAPHRPLPAVRGGRPVAVPGGQVEIQANRALQK